MYFKSNTTEYPSFGRNEVIAAAREGCEIAAAILNSPLRKILENQPPCDCGCDFRGIWRTKNIHAGQLRCLNCGHHFQWISKRDMAQIEEKKGQK